MGVSARSSQRGGTPRRITATVPHTLCTLLIERADLEGRSVSNLVAYLLERALGRMDPPWP